MKKFAAMPRSGCRLLVAICLSTAAEQDMPLSQILIDRESWQLVADGFK